MKKILTSLFVALVLLSLSSCFKAPAIETPANTAAASDTTATSFASMKVDQSFDWSTSRKINIRFSGNTEHEEQLVLKVVTADGTILFQKLQKGNEDFAGLIEVPAHIETLTVIYGSFSQSFNCKDGTITLAL